jgi:uncharacterized membrane protein
MTEQVITAIVAALFLATVANRLVEGFITPIWKKFEIDTFWLMYIAWAIGGVLVWLGDVNLFSEYIANDLYGKILTAIVAGGGANMIHDIFDRPTIEG